MFNTIKQRNVLRNIVGAFITLVLLQPAWLTAAETAPDNADPSASVVEIITNNTDYDKTSPWNTTWKSWGGSGFVVAGNRILTTASLVERAVYITIRPNGTPQTFEAEVESISHEVNLAVLKVKDETFFKDRPPLPLGDLPKPEAKVSLYGYPIGGYKISITQGIVSRIEYQTYAHSGLTFQAIQVDASINAGSTGSPAFVDGKVIGIVSEAAPEIAETETENIGYVIPAARIQQLLDDLQDDSLDGVPELWVDYQFITNPSQKKHYKLTKDQSGILVDRLCAHADTAMQLVTGDVITAIDGKPITEAGFIQTNGKQYSNFQSHIDLHQIDDIVSLDIIRDGTSVKQNIKLNKRSFAKDLQESTPRYFIYGGFVFLATSKAPKCETIAEGETGETKATEDQVEIVQVLPSASNIGFHEAAPMTLLKVNGDTFTTFEEFHALVKNSSAKTLVLENETGYQVVINRALADSEQADLLDKYHIQKAQSSEVDAW
jgi:S1-C subfamily serine protease